MAQTSVNFRMDTDLKENMENLCQDLGITMTTAFIIFAKKMTREKRIPFDVAVDPFYSESNIAHIKKGIAALDAGLGHKHELIED